MGILCTQREECWVVAVIYVCKGWAIQILKRSQVTNALVRKTKNLHNTTRTTEEGTIDAMRRDTVVSGWIVDYSLLMWRIYCGIYLV